MNPFVRSRGCHVVESNSSNGSSDDDDDDDAFEGERTFTYTQSNFWDDPYVFTLESLQYLSIFILYIYQMTHTG